MNEVETSPAVDAVANGADSDVADSPPDPDIEAAMSAALAPVVARATNGGNGADVRPTEEAEPMNDTAAQQPAPTPAAEPVMPKAAPPAAAPVGATPSRAHNRVYEHLVEGEDDVIGLITYSLYKQDKREWWTNWRRDHGADPTADQVEAFVNGQLTFAQRDRYRTAARQVLDAYASVAVELEKPLIIRDGIAGRVEAAVKKVEASARWWRQLPAVLIGALLSAGIVILLVVILIAAGVDLAGYLGFA